MALVSSLFTAITGMRNHQTMLDVISNNVANVNTIGFKGGRVMFRDLLSQTVVGASGYNSATNVGGTNPIQSGTGVAVASVDTRFSQGTLQATGVATDLAINGDGFFMTKTGTSTLYTRAGSFRFDGNGNLVDPGGGIVQGWSASTPTSSTGVLNPLGIPQVDSTRTTEIGNIRIPTGTTLQPHETTQVSFVGNLDGGATAANLANSAGVAGTTQLTTYSASVPDATSPADLGTPTTYTVGQTQMAFTVYDSLGNAHQMTATLTNISGTQIPGAALGEVYDNNTWAWTADTNPADTTVHLALDNSTYTDPITGVDVRASSSGLIHFNTNGSLDWVAYADRNAEHFGTRYDQLAANDPNIPGGNTLNPANIPVAPAPLPQGPNDAAAPTPDNDLWADLADQDPHNSTIIGFEGAVVTAGDFRGAADLSDGTDLNNNVDTATGLVVTPLDPNRPDNAAFDNPGVTQVNWTADPLLGQGGTVTSLAAGRGTQNDVFDLEKCSIVLVYQNVPAGSPIPPAFDTPGRLVDLDVSGAGGWVSPTSPAAPQSVQQWYVQSFNIDWGTVSVITQADFDRNNDPSGMVALATNDESAAGGSQVWAYNNGNPVKGTGDGVADGTHDGFTTPAAPWQGGESGALGDHASDLEMPWDPRVVRTSYGLRDGLTQDATGTWDSTGTIYTPKFAARLEAQDGYGQGTLSGVSVNTSGTVIGVFNTVEGNTIYQELARIAVANFANPAGLAKNGDTHWTSTANSGSANVGEALSQGRGSVIGGVLEQSNVDLSEELTNMIVAQRGFEVNARLVTTSDRILDTLVNLAR